MITELKLLAYEFFESRGVDRLLEVAEMLPKDLRSKVVFLVVGDMSERGLLNFFRGSSRLKIVYV